jgi:hypothetical protein
MDNKLTLKLNTQVIKQAKIYARKKNTSLSRLIEAYLQFLTSGSSSADSNEITPLVKSLSGVINSSKAVENKNAYKKYLSKKYTK